MQTTQLVGKSLFSTFDRVAVSPRRNRLSNGVPVLVTGQTYQSRIAFPPVLVNLKYYEYLLLVYDNGIPIYHGYFSEEEIFKICHSR